MSLFPVHLTGAGQENKTFCCCCPTFSGSGLRRVQKERCSCHYGRQFGPLSEASGYVQEASTGTTRHLGEGQCRAGHSVISSEGPRSCLTLIDCVSVCVCVRGVCFGECVCVCRGDRGEEHALPGQKPAAMVWKPDTSLVFRRQVIAGKMRR